jgi:hypothetical protein
MSWRRSPRQYEVDTYTRKQVNKLYSLFTCFYLCTFKIDEIDLYLNAFIMIINIISYTGDYLRVQKEFVCCCWLQQ